MSSSPASFSATRFLQYLRERFPVVPSLLSAIALTGASHAAAQADLLGGGRRVQVDLVVLGGVTLVFLFLFLLRVFDEHKDFAHDAATRPDRPVQRGLVRLEHLRVLGLLAVVGQLALTVPYGWWPVIAFVATLAYSVLMYYEFFVAKWLKAHFITYAVSHNVVMALLVFALGMRFAAPASLDPSVALVALAGLAVPLFFGFDIMRKMWAPENEIAGVDSYTSRLGIRGAAILAATVMIIASAIAGWIGLQLGGRWGWGGVVAGVTVLGLLQIASFAALPTPKKEKALQAASALHILALLFGIAIVPMVRYGVELG